MNKFSNLVNWENLQKKSDEFQKNKPFRFGFVEEFFNRDFYEKLYSDYPRIDDSWDVNSDFTKFQYYRILFSHGNDTKSSNLTEKELGENWTLLSEYAQTEEFISNFRNFSGIQINKVKNFSLIAYKKGGFQLPHIHNAGSHTVVCMFYFSKNWPVGEAGGTYIASDEDESKIIFEPYNLDNTAAFFHDGPFSAHGCRIITHDLTRQALQITFEKFSEKDGWSGDKLN
tara:strand:- start:1578 stop:2261 length:684 start_codon:yes stop_codon:yes gene_type:complete